MKQHKLRLRPIRIVDTHQLEAVTGGKSTVPDTATGAGSTPFGEYRGFAKATGRGST